uniref:Uncharacterized protein n=1 Tax=Romanomermis culicivorax TaxID=13658 RepID=A0A915JKK0_ROMCU
MLPIFPSPYNHNWAYRAYFDFDLMTEDFLNFESMPEASTLEF